MTASASRCRGGFFMRTDEMSIVHVGKIYACSRCPGWQTDNAQRALDHERFHHANDKAEGRCTHCLRFITSTRRDGRHLYAQPCGHRIR